MTVSFVSWVRGGILADGAAWLVPANNAARLTARLRAKVNGALAPAIDLTVLGPGDVVGIDPAQVIRSDPHAGAETFETTRFAAIEFARGDLPWLFTPQSATSRLRPWICLAVVPIAEC